MTKIPLNDPENADELGCPAFFRVIRTSMESMLTFYGGMLRITTMGEPLQFVYSKVEVPHSFLWRTADLHRAALKQLVDTLLQAVSEPPALLICWQPDFCYPVAFEHVPVKICRTLDSNFNLDVQAVDFDGIEVHSSWSSDQPEPGITDLYDILARRHLILEPLHRTFIGLNEVFSIYDR